MSRRIHADDSSIASPERRAERNARRAAGRKLGFLIHLTVFVLVNGFLLLSSLTATTQGTWVRWPSLGWGLGLAIHGIVAFGAFNGLYARLLDREIQRARAARGGHEDANGRDRHA